MTRLIFAFLLAPLAAPLVWCIATFVAYPSEVNGLGDLIFGIALLAIVTAPITYATTFLVGAPSYLILKRLGRLTLGPVAAIAGLAGAAVMYWIVEFPAGLSGLVVGALCGIGSAVVFWVIARPDRSSGSTTPAAAPGGQAAGVERPAGTRNA